MHAPLRVAVAGKGLRLALVPAPRSQRNLRHQTSRHYAFGDYDAAGWFASQHIDKMLRDYADQAGFRHPIHFERVALSPEQIDAFGLEGSTRPSKERDDEGCPIPSAPSFRVLQEHAAPGLVGQSCELDALDPDDLRGLVTGVVTRHMSDERLDELEAEEAAEKAEIMAIVDRMERRR
jgi:hypothetical protein